MNLAGYLLLFVAVGVGFILVNLLVGKIVRPNRPDAEKGTIYECGEPTIGSAWVQFDLRFYVVALLFVIFDVEVAFFFPWAEVFGKANAVAAYGATVPDENQVKDYGEKAVSLIPPWPNNRGIIEDYKDPAKLSQRLRPPNRQPNLREVEANSKTARTLGVLALGEIVIFFGVLLVGFAYLWRRGDLEWVRSLADRAAKDNARSAMPLPTVKPAAPEPEVVATAIHGH
jgi:NADH-quinone oxidoreductase subunit A